MGLSDFLISSLICLLLIKNYNYGQVGEWVLVLKKFLPAHRMPIATLLYLNVTDDF